MTDLNHVVVIGRLTKSLDDSNFGYLQSGTARANISLAVNRSRKDGEQWVDDVSFLDVLDAFVANISIPRIDFFIVCDWAIIIYDKIFAVGSFAIARV